MLTPIAHTPADGCSPPHLLDEHLRKVGELAASFAAPAWADWARQAGRWHDLGKYDPAFQDYIRRDSGYEAHLLDGQPSHPSHSLAGAQHALLTQPKFGRLLAYLMHHPGAVVSRSELTEHIYAQDFDRDSNTIEVFVGRLRKKLGTQLIETVRGLGYRLRPPP